MNQIQVWPKKLYDEQFQVGDLDIGKMTEEAFALLSEEEKESDGKDLLNQLLQKSHV